MKQTVSYVCSECGNAHNKWQGQCVSCGAWNSLSEREVADIARVARKTGASTKNLQAAPVSKIRDILESKKGDTSSLTEKISTGVSEIDRVFGGGILPGAFILLAGEPGVGKSTLTLTITDSLAGASRKVIYFSGEESEKQVALRASRMDIQDKNIHICNETRVESLIATALKEEPDCIVVDSIQVMYSEELGSAPGSIAQIRYVAELLMEYAKKYGVTVIVIGHVNKEGHLAGPKVLEHLVDVVTILEGESGKDLRVLRTQKNRFGPTDEVGVFIMKETGLEEVSNPSELFLQEKLDDTPGSIVTATTEGTRSFLFEVQALTTYTKFGYPKRTSLGYDTMRLHMLLAVLGKYTSIQLDSHDVYINIVGGIRVKDTGVDVPIILALSSSKMQKSLPKNTVVFGEVGLTGEIRSVSGIERRLKEASKIGFTTAIIPASCEISDEITMEIKRVKHISEIVKLLK